MAQKQQWNRNFILLGVILLFLLSVGFFVTREPNQDSFKAPGRSWNSPKKVEDYFVETMHMPPEEARTIRFRGNGTIDLRIGANTTLQGLVGNLAYYGFIRDEKTFLYALEHTTDTTSSQNAINVGKTGTIDRNAEYRISEDMTAWELADILLNKPAGHFSYDEYNYFFMP